jgi:hypothetical protein
MSDFFDSLTLNVGAMLFRNVDKELTLRAA